MKRRAAPAREVIPLSVLDGYKVRWDRQTVVRDIVQNFFDEVADFKQVQIEVDAAARTVRVAGPSTFDMEYLRYIGATSKAAPEKRTAGGFGEGFKICALVLLRDYGVTVDAGSGTWQLRVVFRPAKFGRELCYDVTRLAAAQAYPGSYVALAGVDKALCREFGTARELFRHADNPRLAQPVFVDAETGVGVYRATTPRGGDLFYRRQHRGQVRYGQGDALTLAYDDRLPALDADRDRRNFRAAYPLAVAIARRLPDAVLVQLVMHLRVYWSRGSRVLAAFASEAARRGLKVTFPRRWLARGRFTYALDRHAERNGFHLAQRALARCGMPTVEARFGAAGAPRPPTLVERARMGIAREVYLRLTGARPLYTRYGVLDAAEARDKPEYHGRSCKVHARYLAAPFAQGIGRCLAALALGVGEREHTNAMRLTDLLGGAVKLAGQLESYARRWHDAGEDPERELAAAGTTVETATDVDDDDDDAVDKRLRVPAQVLAPAGFPPAKVIADRIRAVGEAMGVFVAVRTLRVNGPRGAARHYARGVPSVWIGAIELEAPTRGGPAYAVRTFVGDDGSPSFVPSEATIRAAFAAVVRSPKLALPTARLTRANAALDAYLRAHDEPAFRERMIDKASWELFHDLPTQWHFAWRSLVVQVVQRLAAARPWDVARVAEVVQGVRDEAMQCVVALQAAVASRLPRLAGAPELEEQLETWAVGRADAALTAQRPVAEALAAPLAAMPHAAPLVETVHAAHLDEVCARLCADRALDRLAAAQDAGPDAIDAGVLQAALARDLAVVLARHDARDEFGDALSCHDAGEALDAACGPAVASASEENDSAAEIARHVAGAWEAALAEGKGELEAASRALDAAQAYDAREGDAD